MENRQIVICQRRCHDAAITELFVNYIFCPEKKIESKRIESESKRSIGSKSEEMFGENKQSVGPPVGPPVAPLRGWFMRPITCKLSSDISTLYTTGRASIMSPTNDYWTPLNILLTQYTFSQNIQYLQTIYINIDCIWVQVKLVLFALTASKKFLVCPT